MTPFPNPFVCEISSYWLQSSLRVGVMVAAAPALAAFSFAAGFAAFAGAFFLAATSFFGLAAGPSPESSSSSPESES